jgi:hypothetical protein
MRGCYVVLIGRLGVCGLAPRGWGHGSADLGQPNWSATPRSEEHGESMASAA